MSERRAATGARFGGGDSDFVVPCDSEGVRDSDSDVVSDSPFDLRNRSSDPPADSDTQADRPNSEDSETSAAALPGSSVKG